MIVAYNPLYNPLSGVYTVVHISIRTSVHPSKDLAETLQCHMSSVFWWLKLVIKIISLIKKTIPQKKDIILPYIGYHNTPK